MPQTAQSDPIQEFIRLPRDQQMSTLQQMSPEKQDKVLAKVKEYRANQKQAVAPKTPQSPSIMQRYETAVDPYTRLEDPDPKNPLNPREAVKAVGNIGAGGMGLFLHPINTLTSMGGMVTAPLEMLEGHPFSSTVPGQLVHSLQTRPFPAIEGMVGASGAAEAIPEMVGPIARGVRGITDSAKEGVRSSLKESAGISPFDIREEAQKTVDANNKEIALHQTNLAKANQAHGEELLKLKQKYDQTKRDAEAERTEAVTKRGQNLLKSKQKYDADVRKAEEEHRNAVTDAERKNAETQRVYNQKIGETVKKNRDIEAARQAAKARQAKLQVTGSQLMHGLKRMEESTREKANGLYSAVREKTGGAFIPRSSLQDEVTAAEKKWIRGSPEKVKEFRAMMQTQERTPNTVLADQTAENLGYRDFQHAITDEKIRNTLSRVLPPDVFDEASGKAVSPLSWNDLQGFYEETGQRLASGTLAGDVYQAVKHVHKFIGDSMQKLADEKGAGEQFREARSFYRDFMETFHEPQGPSGSGSPVAQALLSKDPLRAVDYFSGKSGDRGIVMLRKYDPELADLAQESQREVRNKPLAARAEKKSLGAIPVPAKATAPPGSNLPLPSILPPEISPASQPLPPILPPEPSEVMPPPELRTMTPEDVSKNQAERIHEAGLRRLHSTGANIAGNLLTGGVSTWAVAEMIRGQWEYGAALGAARVLIGMSAKQIAKLLENETVANWLSHPTEKEIQVYRSLTPDQKAVFGESLTPLLEQAKKRGMKVDPALRNIIMASGAVAGALPKNHPLNRSQSQ